MVCGLKGEERGVRASLVCQVLLESTDSMTADSDSRDLTELPSWSSRSSDTLVRRAGGHGTVLICPPNTWSKGSTPCARYSTANFPGSTSPTMESFFSVSASGEPGIPRWHERVSGTSVGGTVPTRGGGLGVSAGDTVLRAVSAERFEHWRKCFAHGSTMRRSASP